MPWPATSLCARGGKEVFRAHADCRSFQTAAFNYRDLYCWRHSIRQAGNVLLVEVVIPQTHRWVRRHPLGHHDAGLHRQPGTHRERISRLSATDLDQLRWIAEARM